MLVDVYLVGGKERLPDDVDLPTRERWPFLGVAGVCEYGWRTRYTHRVRGGHPTAVKRPGVSAHT